MQHIEGTWWYKEGQPKGKRQYNSCMFFFVQVPSDFSPINLWFGTVWQCISLAKFGSPGWWFSGIQATTVDFYARFSSYTLCITKTAMNHISLKVCIVKNIEKNIAFMIWYINWSAILWATFYRITVVENGTMFPVACRYKGFIVETWLGDFFGPSTDFTNRSLGFINKSQNSLNRSRIGMAPSQKEAKAVCKVYPVYPIFKPPDADIFMRS